jgi:hypothetical protein
VIRHRSLVVTIVCFLAALPLFAQQSSAPPADKPAENSEILIAKVKADKKLLVAQNMGLTEAEAKNFWPVYDSYQKDLTAINERLIATVAAFAKSYNTGAPVSDDTAKKLMEDYLAIEQDEVNLKKTYAKKLTGVIPTSKIARYLQIETKVRAAIKWDMAKSVPLVQ